ncbi:DNA-binding response regulator [Fulvivirgaceae bacterium PWU4]|uniref:DNA-binding response regulator n=1 Tax=Chryseosolibacter histidini TaxID=2782349 RepID=A0AAP2DPH8_9BACT|nr:LuxR C-terminal-related transcriptional regulator [Chryseosolibacter histidini]MBT1700171.1 DNA-binding response regulator [Chryseosolibacter histidini]
MKRTILIYGAVLAVLVFLLKFVEYRYIVRDLSLEFYIGLVAILFTVIGVWAGLKITRKKTIMVMQPAADFKVNEDQLRQLGISRREYEVLELMARGLTNQEIGDRLFVSLNTVKTHSSNLFVKLDVRRRTQAIQKAKELHLLP